MRLKTGIWVSAFLRRWQAAGQYGAVIARGAEEAGAVYVIVNHLDGTFHLFGPAPGPSFRDDGERRWMEEARPPADQAAVDAVLEKRRKGDPDIWIIEIEDRKGTAGLTPEPE
jgi:hypothetical protein